MKLDVDFPTCFKISDFIQIFYFKLVQVLPKYIGSSFLKSLKYLAFTIIV